VDTKTCDNSQCIRSDYRFGCRFLPLLGLFGFLAFVGLLVFLGFLAVGLLSFEKVSFNICGKGDGSRDCNGLKY
jgi:hypothetical protein